MAVAALSIRPPSAPLPSPEPSPLYTSPVTKMLRTFEAAHHASGFVRSEEASEAVYQIGERVWDLAAKTPVRSHADAAAKLRLVRLWHERGERADLTDRLMVEQVIDWLEGQY